jgi:hypothetical protein
MMQGNKIQMDLHRDLEIRSRVARAYVEVQEVIIAGASFLIVGVLHDNELIDEIMIELAETGGTEVERRN